jgi:hypothetical protein
MKCMRFIATGLLIFFISSCNYVTYTPRSKSNIRREKPSIFLCERIVDFRVEQGYWPVSKEDFITKGKKYYDAFQGFRYNYTHFKIIDSNTMRFYFTDHIADLENHNQTQKTDLNKYGGYVKFFKVNDKFAYKIKMQ